MNQELTFVLLPRDEQQSAFDWMNIDRGTTRVGKARGVIDGNRLTICSINIFPQFERRGYGRKTIKMFQAHFDRIVADRVRYKAIGFWEKMGFRSDYHGNFVWKRKREPSCCAV